MSGGELFDYLVKRGRLPLGEVHCNYMYIVCKNRNVIKDWAVRNLSDCQCHFCLELLGIVNIKQVNHVLQ